MVCVLQNYLHSERLATGLCSESLRVICDGKCRTCLVVDEGADHIAKSREGKVDFGGFFQSVPRGLRPALALTAGQINQIELSNTCMSSALLHKHLFGDMLPAHVVHKIRVIWSSQ